MGASLALIGIILAFIAGSVFTKGITININRNDNASLATDEEGKPKYNESLADLLPLHMRQELEELQRRSEA